MNENIASQNSVALMKKWLSCKWPLKWYVKEVVHKNTVKYVSVTLTELSWTMLLICLSTKFEQTSPEVWRWKLRKVSSVWVVPIRLIIVLANWNENFTEITCISICMRLFHFIDFFSLKYSVVLHKSSVNLRKALKL